MTLPSLIAFAGLVAAAVGGSVAARRWLPVALAWWMGPELPEERDWVDEIYEAYEMKGAGES